MAVGEEGDLQGGPARVRRQRILTHDQPRAALRVLAGLLPRCQHPGTGRDASDSWIVQALLRRRGWPAEPDGGGRGRGDLHADSRLVRVPRQRLDRLQPRLRVPGRAVQRRLRRAARAGEGDGARLRRVRAGVEQVHGADGLQQLHAENHVQKMRGPARCQGATVNTLPPRNLIGPTRTQKPLVFWSDYR